MKPWVSCIGTWRLTVSMDAEGIAAQPGGDMLTAEVARQIDELDRWQAEHTDILDADPRHIPLPIFFFLAARCMAQRARSSIRRMFGTSRNQAQYVVRWPNSTLPPGSDSAVHALKRDPSQVLRPANMPDPNAIEAAGQRDEPGNMRLEPRRDTTGIAAGLVHDHGGIAQQDHIGNAAFARDAQRFEEREPFGVIVVAMPMVSPVIGNSDRNDCRLDVAGVGAAATIEVDFHGMSASEIREPNDRIHI
jgi:hypothetical protein